MNRGMGTPGKFPAIHGQSDRDRAISSAGRPSMNTDQRPPMSPVRMPDLGVSTERPYTDWTETRNSQSQEFQTVTTLRQMTISDRSTATARMADRPTHEVSQ